jgi:hypothetical protein
MLVVVACMKALKEVIAAAQLLKYVHIANPTNNQPNISNHLPFLLLFQARMLVLLKVRSSPFGNTIHCTPSGHIFTHKLDNE